MPCRQLTSTKLLLLQIGDQANQLLFQRQPQLSKQRSGSKKDTSAKTGISARKNSLRVESMPCVSPDGKPTSSGMAVLKSLKNGTLSPEEIANKTGQPLFRVRSGLRELKNAGFVEETENKYVLSKTGNT